MHFPTERVGYKAMVQRAFSERLKEECVRRYAVRGRGAAVDNRSRVGGIGDVHAGATLAVRKRPLSPWRPATPLSDGPPRRGPHPAWPPGALSGDRQGFGRVPSLLRGARACSATPIAATRPSGYYLNPVHVR